MVAPAVAALGTKAVQSGFAQKAGGQLLQGKMRRSAMGEKASNDLVGGMGMHGEKKLKAGKGKDGPSTEAQVAVQGLKTVANAHPVGRVINVVDDATGGMISKQVAGKLDEIKKGGPMAMVGGPGCLAGWKGQREQKQSFLNKPAKDSLPSALKPKMPFGIK